MVDAIFYFITVPMVYLAFAWCLLGIGYKVYQVTKAPAHPFTLKVFPDKDHPVPSAGWGALSMPTIRRNKPLLWAALVLFHLGLLVLILAHLDLLPSINIYPEDSNSMIGNGAVGVVITIAVIYFLVRRFKSPVRQFSAPGDYLLLLLLFLAFLSGDIISWSNSWNSEGFVLTKQDFGAYLASLVSFTWEDPSEILTSPHYVVLVAHVLLANLLLMTLPFSKMMHGVFAAPLNKLRRG